MSSPVRIRRSVFDRLLDNNPDMPEGLMQTCTVEQLRDAVARDLESLLNSRAAINFDAVDLGPHTARSVLCFGVRDFVGREAFVTDWVSISQERIVASELRHMELRGVALKGEEREAFNATSQELSHLAAGLQNLVVRFRF